jgi:plastocyanin
VCFGSFAGLAILVLAGCGSDDNFTATSTQAAQIVPCPPTGTTNVSIQDFSYTPDNVSISVNGIVKWTNNGLSFHTATSGTGGTTGTPDGKFDSGNLASGQTVCMQFLAPGTYPYFCVPHPFMIGSVSVTASSTVITKVAALDNTQETTSSTSPGKGGGILTVDTTTGNASGFVASTGVPGTAAHIHSAARGVPGGVIVTLVGGPDIWVVPDNTTLSATNVTAFQNGNLYYNIHSAAFPDGEIRGQIDSYSLLGPWDY